MSIAGAEGAAAASGTAGRPAGRSAGLATLAWTLAVATGLAAAIGVVPPLLPLVASAFTLSETGAAWVTSAFGLSRLALDLPLGAAADRLGRHHLFVGGGLVLSAGLLMCAVAPGPGVLYAGRILTGAGHAASSLMLLLLVLISSPAHRRSRAGSLLEGTVMLSFLATGLATGPVADALGWRAAFGLIGLLTLGATLLGARLPTWREVEAGAAAGSRTVRGGAVPTGTAPAGVARGAASGVAAGGGASGAAGLRGPAGPATDPPAAAVPFRLPAAVRIAPLYLAAFGIAFTWAGLLLTLVPLAASGRHGLDATAIGRILSLAYAGDLLLLLPAATLADRTGGRGVLAAALAVAAVAAPAVLLAPGVGWLTAAVTLLGGTFAVWLLPAALLVRAVPAGTHGRTVGTYRFAIDLGFVVGPVALARAVEAGGWPAAAVAAAGVPLVAVAGLGLAGMAARRAG